MAQITWLSIYRKPISTLTCPTVASLAATLGRGAMANHWIDIKNADVILIIGANPAENHPVSFYWIAKAKENGATIVHIDPRYTRTSAQADIYISIRSGTDIAFLGGLIKYIIDNNLSNVEYVKNHTNAAFIVRNTFKIN